MKVIDRIDELESLRGLLAIWVIVYHVMLTAGIHTDNWPTILKFLGNGGHAVDVFIIISGFVIFFLLDNTQETYCQFIIRRFFRLFPIYFVCLLIAANLVDLSISGLQALPWSDIHNANRIRIFRDTSDHYWMHLFAHITLLHGLIPSRLLPSTDFAFIGQAWSISLEWQFYLVAPLIIYLTKKYNNKYIAQIMVAVLLAHYFLRGSIAFLPTKVPLFFVGIISYYTYKVFIINMNLELWRNIKVLLVPSCIFFNEPSVMIWILIFSSIVSVRVGVANTLERMIVNILLLKKVLWMGRLSYPLYMIHMLVIYIALKFFIPELLSVTWLFFSVLVFLAILLSVICSYILSNFIEYPMIAVGKKVAYKFGLLSFNRFFRKRLGFSA